MFDKAVTYCPMEEHLIHCHHDCEGCPLYIEQKEEKEDES